MRILKSNWVVTLTATLIGVFVALYLNERVSSNKMEEQKIIATQNIVQEIAQNNESIADNIRKHEAILAIFRFTEANIDDQGRMIMHPDTMNAFVQQFPGTLTVTDSSQQENGLYEYSGDVDLQFDFSYINLTNLGWETLKSSGLSTSYDFNCLMYLEKLDNLTQEFFIHEKQFINLLKNRHNYDQDNYDETLKSELQFLLKVEKALLESYDNSHEKLKNCM